MIRMYPENHNIISVVNQKESSIEVQRNEFYTFQDDDEDDFISSTTLDDIDLQIDDSI